MAYKVRPGIVLLKICDANLLVASRPLWEHCSRIRQISNLWASCWRIMEKDGKTDADAVRAFSSLLNKSESETRERLQSMFDTLAGEGYLIRTEDGV